MFHSMNSGKNSNRKKNSIITEIAFPQRELDNVTLLIFTT